MTQKATRGAAKVRPIDLARARTRRRAAEAQAGEALLRSLARLIASVRARWQGHEPEIAILTATTLMLAVAAVFAGADLLFTFMVVLAAAVTIWSPWRQPE
jgi:hypothetical protein